MLIFTDLQKLNKMERGNSAQIENSPMKIDKNDIALHGILY